MCVRLLYAVASKLLSKEFVEFKTNKYYIHVVQQSHAAADAADDDVSHDDDHDDDDDDSPAASFDPLLVQVSNVPAGLSGQELRMILENKRYGAGAVRRLEFSQSEQSALVEFEERAGMCCEQLV